MNSRELTTLRRRQAELAEALDRAPGDTLAQGPALLVKVFAETAVPTATMKYFACHPVKVAGAESEGTAPTLTADAGQTLYVAVLGTPVPVAGDYLIARLIGGRWVADKANPSPPTDCGRICASVVGCASAILTGASVTVTSKTIVSITVTNGGTSYISPPAVVISGTNGRGGTAVAVLSGTVVDHIDVTNGGQYHTTPTISFSGGGGSGAVATATLSGASTVGTCTTTGQVSQITVTAAGTNYTSVPTVAVAAPPSGTTATGTANMTTTSIASVALTAGGHDYITAPTAVIGGAIHGTGTTLSARLAASAVNSLTIVSGGAAYTPGIGYALTFNNTGTGGTGAAGTFDVDAGGHVTNPVITAGGANYTTAPAVSVTGAGSGASITAGLPPQPVATLTRTTAGSGYQLGDSPTVVFSGGGGGSGATGTATLGSIGVASVTITNNGSGYTAALATVTFSGGGGSGASASGTVAKRCCVPIPAAGGYTVSGTATNYNTASTNVLVTTCTAGSTTTANPVTLTPVAGYSCTRNGCCPLTEQPDPAPYVIIPNPTTVTLNDGFGDIALTFNAPLLRWEGYASRSASHTLPAGACTGATPAPGSIPLFFSLSCNELRISHNMCTSLGSCSGDGGIPSGGTADKSTWCGFGGVDGTSGFAGSSSVTVTTCFPYTFDILVRIFSTGGTGLSGVYGTGDTLMTASA